MTGPETETGPDAPIDTKADSEPGIAAGGEVGGEAEEAPQPGFFGKIPATGDFVSRGLPDGFRRAWDLWVARHLAPRQKAAQTWPAGGVRFRLRSGGRVAAGVIQPSADSVGRRFPLSLVLIGADLPAPEALDPWCEAAAGLDTLQPPDALWGALADLDAPEGTGPDAGLLLWTREAPAQPADPSAPGPVLDALWPRAVEGHGLIGTP